MSVGPDRERLESSEIHISIESLVGLFNRKGTVKFSVSDGDEQRVDVFMTPEEAREQAINLLEAAGAAVRDESFYRTAVELGMDEDQAGRFLAACRKANKKHD